VTENEIAKIIVDAAYQIHLELGPGLLESVYETVLEYELTQRGLEVRRQPPIPVVYKGLKMPDGFRADLIVNRSVIVEVKSQETLPPVAYKVLLTYLRLTNLKLGLMINFHESTIKTGIRRVVNGL
jgi:GxxExxY protein